MAKAPRPPYFAIVSFTLFLLSAFTSYVLYDQVQKEKRATARAQEEAKANKEKFDELDSKYGDVGMLVTGDAKFQLNEIQKAFDEAKNALKGLVSEERWQELHSPDEGIEIDLLKIVSELLNQVSTRDNKIQNLESAKANLIREKEDLEQRKKAAEARLEQQLAVALDEKKAALTQLNNLQTEVDRRIKALEAEVNKQLRKKDTIISDQNEKIRDQDDQIGRLEREVKKLRARINVLTRKSSDEKRVGEGKKFKIDLEMADGRILSVDNTIGMAVIDIGRKDGVRRGMRFSVYSNKGPKRFLKGQVIVAKVMDLVSETTISLNRGQGQRFFILGKYSDDAKADLVEKIQKAGGKTTKDLNESVSYVILGPEPDKRALSAAQDLRIPIIWSHLLDSFLANREPINKGDVIINPAYSRLRKEKFFLLGGKEHFIIPKHILEAKLRDYGAEIVTEVGPDTDYVVKGGKGGPPNQREILKKANKAGVTLMREEELAAFLEL